MPPNQRHQPFYRLHILFVVFAADVVASPSMLSTKAHIRRV